MDSSHKREDSQTDSPPIITAERWRVCVDTIDESQLTRLARWRGWKLDTCLLLRKHEAIGLHKGFWCFANIDPDGDIRSIHYRLDPKDGEKASWRHDPIGAKTHSLVLGSPASAQRIGLFESQWDAITLVDKFSLNPFIHRDWALVSTRGASNAKVLGEVEINPDATIYLFPQNDEAGQRWIEAVLSILERPAFVVSIPKSHKDLGEWGLDGLNESTLKKSIQDAVVRQPAKDPPFAEGLKREQKERSAPQAIAAFYDSARKEYLMQNTAGRWHSYDISQFKLQLRARGYSASKPADGLVSPAEQVILDIQNGSDVQYAGALAGRKAGFYEENAIRILVTSSPLIIPAEKRDWPTLRKVLRNMLAGPTEPWGDQQLIVFNGWLRHARLALLSEKFQPGQALAFCGEVDSGKSLLQAIITQALGGRAAKAGMYLLGRTDFNSELFAAEYLMLEDECVSTSREARSALADAIKTIAVNRLHPCHGKRRDIINLSVWWRLTISLNKEPEKMLVLPRLSSDVADKLILLRAICHPMPEPTVSADEKAEFWKKLMRELPGYVHWLETEFEIPAVFVSQRFGIREFHHPELLEALNELSPASTLLELIDQAEPWGKVCTEWEGTATELRQFLVANERTRRETERLLSWPNACGQYLGELAKMKPARVKNARTDQARNWLVFSP